MAQSSIVSAIQKLRILLTSQEKWQFVRMICFAICNSFLEVGTAGIIVLLAQSITNPSVGQKYLSLLGFNQHLTASYIIFYISVGCGILYLIKNILSAGEIFYQNIIIQKMNANFKNRLLRKYAAISYERYISKDSSKIHTLIEKDVHFVFSLGITALASAISESIVFFSLTFLIIFINPMLSLVTFGIGGTIGWIILKVLLPRSYKWGNMLQETGALSSKNLLQFLQGFKEIILSGKQETFINFHHHYSAHYSRIWGLATSTNMLPRLIIEVLFVGLFICTITFLCLEHDAPFQIIGILGAYLYTGFRLMPGLNRIINGFTSFKSYVPTIDHLHAEYMELDAKRNYLDISNFSFKQSIIFKDVSFSYANRHVEVLHKINIEIKKGECVGVVGESGAGKSTFMDLLLGLLNPTNGTVLIDHQYPVNASQWHQKIGYVPQHLYLTDDTIEANIAFGEDLEAIEEKRILEVIQDAQLGDFIHNLPNGIKTVVGERGVRLSGGERQRIAIARALYRNPEVLLFDEATAALDHETEEKLMETIYAVGKKCTVIMIAHRLSTLSGCQKIIKINKGKISIEEK